MKNAHFECDGINENDGGDGCGMPTLLIQLFQISSSARENICL